MHDHDAPPRPPWIPPLRLRPPEPSPTMRVSDAERREVTDALCRHYGDGRLDESELEERLARATAARTRADLAPLLSDLPPTVTPRPEARPAGTHHLRRLAILATVGLALVWTLSSLASERTHGHVGWVIVVLGAILVFDRSRARNHRRPPD